MSRTRGDGPAAKESAGSAAELFIIFSPVTGTRGPLHEREKGGEEIDWDLQRQK